MTAGDAEMSHQCRKYFLQYSTFASENLRFEHGGAKLASCPGRHLTSLSPWLHLVRSFPLKGCFLRSHNWRISTTFNFGKKCNFANSKFCSNLNVDDLKKTSYNATAKLCDGFCWELTLNTLCTKIVLAVLNSYQ